MCRCCNGVSSVQERVANHDFMEQLADFYGHAPKFPKNPKTKNHKKSILNKIEYQLTQIRAKVQESPEYIDFEKSLLALLQAPFDEFTTIEKFEDVMAQIRDLQWTDVLAHYRSLTHGTKRS